MNARKLTAAMLALALTASPAAMAANSADQRLAQVTLAVKNTLSIDDGYTDFYGEPNETPLGTKWNLEWYDSEGDRSLNVTATDQGKVLNYNRSATRDETFTDGYGPHFPAMTQDQAKAKAEEFLARVLTTGESAVFDERWNSGVGLNVSQYGFSGGIYLNGIPTPMTFRIWVWVSDGGVTNFWRGD